ncbi:MAG: RNA pseudouridine synthase, partial [Oscillospiraceae bacterium]|nr:RNA pseudouridine synthase [Oscillospiraceae bacterium]
MTNLTVTATGEERLDQLLSRELDLTRSAAQKLLEDGAVTLEGTVPKKNRKTSPGEVYSVLLPDPEPTEALPQNIPLDIVYELSHIHIRSSRRLCEFSSRWS